MKRKLLHVLAIFVVLFITILPTTPVTSAALTITTTSLPNGTIGVAYNQTLTVSGGTGPYNWVVTVGALPTGLSLAPATGAITGNPVDIGATFTVQVTDSLAAIATQALSIALYSPTLPGGTLDPLTINKYVTPLVIPPEMPTTNSSASLDYYEIAVRQFQQQILPAGMPVTTVWSYASVQNPATLNYPAFTIEADYGKRTQVKWINDLIDHATGNYIPHLLPIDQTLHWANPPGGATGRDSMGMNPASYTGPVPIVTHVHGAHTVEDSDGYPEAWYLPAANNIPAGYATVGSAYDTFKAKAAVLGRTWQPGSALYEYPNNQRATTLWYHDHSLGMTRTNVYAGPAGFYLLRGGPDDLAPGILPGPAPKVGDAAGTKYYEIPIVVQDRSFNADGSLFYPANRAFFEGLTPAQLQIPFHPSTTLGGQVSDVAPIWNPEFFGNSMVVNGNTWPYLNVEQRQYRFRLLNGSQSRFLILKMDNGATFYQIGTEGGFLPAVVPQTQLLIGPAERADVIVDFTNVPVGTNIIMQNIAPDSPFGGGVTGIDFPMADPNTTGQVMQFRVAPIVGTDASTPVASLTLPNMTNLGAPTHTQYISLNEEMSMTVWAKMDANGNIIEAPSTDPAAMLFGPAAALLGTWDPVTQLPTPLKWMAPVTERPALNATEMFEIHNFTADAHPIHIHLVQFQVIERVDALGIARPPEAWEVGYKDTVIAYPGEITRLKARFDIAGLFVWHCHILEHEDNEMMRPYVTYDKPIVNAGGNAVINPGTTFTRIGSFTAPGLGPWTATVDYGDGAGSTALAINPDLTFNLSHLYSTTGIYTANVSVTDSWAGIGTGSFSITVNPALTISTAALPDGVVGVAYTQNVTATGGSTPYTWALSAGALPNGLALNSSTGKITGTPTSGGIANFTIKLTDNLGVVATKALSIKTVSPIYTGGPAPAPAPAPPSNPPQTTAPPPAAPSTEDTSKDDTAKGVIDLSKKVNPAGAFMETVTVPSSDGNVRVVIESGNTGLTTKGPVTQISITPMANPPAPPSAANAVALYYDIGPSGTTFSSPVIITLKFDPDKVPQGTIPYIVWWNADKGSWESLETVNIDTVNGTITATVNHFTVFTVFSGVKATTASPAANNPPVAADIPIKAPIPASPEPSNAPTAPVSPLASESAPEIGASPAFNWGVIAGIIVGCLAVILIMIFAIRHRK